MGVRKRRMLMGDDSFYSKLILTVKEWSIARTFLVLAFFLLILHWPKIIHWSYTLYIIIAVFLMESIQLLMGHLFKCNKDNCPPQNMPEEKSFDTADDFYRFWNASSFCFILLSIIVSYFVLHFSTSAMAMLTSLLLIISASMIAIVMLGDLSIPFFYRKTGVFRMNITFLLALIIIGVASVGVKAVDYYSIERNVGNQTINVFSLFVTLLATVLTTMMISRGTKPYDLNEISTQNPQHEKTSQH
jgi:multisubunit Na+/H+ antiporter MnhG subunit